MKKILNNKGISLIEVVVAMFLTAIAVISILPMQDMSMRTGFRSDYLGRAAGIMQAELETQEYAIMNEAIPVVVTTVPAEKDIQVSGLGAGYDGDATFTVFTSITLNPAATLANSWIVNVRVTWIGGPANGISSSIIASRQLNF